MEKRLRDLLERDEKLLWTGRPEPFQFLDRTNKTGIVMGLIIKAAITLAVLVFYIGACKETGSISPGIILIILVLGGIALTNPFLVAGRLRNRTFYGLTDRRILRAGSHDTGVPYKRIKSAALRTDPDGHTSLLCGSRTLKLKPSQWRVEADVDFINNQDEPEAARVILYSIPVDAELEALLSRYLPLS